MSFGKAFINILGNNGLINDFPKFIYSCAAASQQLTFYIFKKILNSLTLTKNLRAP